MLAPLVAFGFVLMVPQQARPVDPAAELAAARALYLEAAYEEALDRLGLLGASEGLADRIDTYRALCLLALGRTGESEQVLEQVLLRNPRFSLDERDVSPRLVSLFLAVRARVLPERARALYASARAEFDARQFDAAVAQLRESLTLLEIAGGRQTADADLRLLAEGFLRLAESAQAGAVAPAGLDRQTMTFRSGAGTAPVYSVRDRDVQAPVEINRQVPTYQAPRGTKPGLYQGLIEVVIDERGRVESATIRRSIAEEFDAVLLAATAEWRFQPALKDGVPVKYRRSYEIIGHSR